MADNKPVIPPVEQPKDNIDSVDMLGAENAQLKARLAEMEKMFAELEKSGKQPNRKPKTTKTVLKSGEKLIAVDFVHKGESPRLKGKTVTRYVKPAIAKALRGRVGITVHD